MATLNKTYHRTGPTVNKGTWGKRGKQDIKFYQSKYWRGIRAQQLSKEPFCAECRKDGRLTSATVADHIIQRHKGGTDEFHNLQSLCWKCHNRKTAKEK